MKPEPEKPPELTLEPLAETGTLGLLAALLRSPGQILHELKSGNAGRVWAVLAIGTAIALALFGVLIGTFSYGIQLWAAPVKIMGGVLFSAAICFPSLYIFGSLGGLRASPREIGGALAMGVSLMALVLLGFAPVLWVFAQSTDSAVFMGTLLLLFWGVAVWLGLGLLLLCARHLGMKNTGHFGVWAIVFVLVSLQMSTSLRPLIRDDGTFFNPEKKSFMVHWIDQMEVQEINGATGR
ncbi:hypothetical protein OAF27_02720 [Verrucomicrobiales bacterium]|nr:hypothetical protein [Verrucomicrobiales bacterium]